MNARSAIPAQASGDPPLLDAGWALLLDVDGTLLDHVIDPATVLAAAALRDLLDELVRHLGGAVGLVSGRAIEDLDRIFAPLRLPCAGQHGMELRTADGGVCRREEAARLMALAAAQLEARVGAVRGVFVENKGLSLTLHYRAAPSEHHRLQALTREVVDALGGDLHWIEASHAFEIRQAHADKGRAIHALMRTPPFLERRPVFIGDDRSDEAGFAVVNALGGLSVKVGTGITQADRRLPGPDAVHTWLAACARHLRAAGEARRA